MQFLQCFDHFAGTQAAGANISGCGMAVFDDPQLANVGHPAPLGQIVSVAYSVADLRAFATNVAFFCHGYCSFIDIFVYLSGQYLSHDLALRLTELKIHYPLGKPRLICEGETAKPRHVQ